MSAFDTKPTPHDVWTRLYVDSSSDTTVTSTARYNNANTWTYGNGYAAVAHSYRNEVLIYKYDSATKLFGTASGAGGDPKTLGVEMKESYIITLNDGVTGWQAGRNSSIYKDQNTGSKGFGTAVKIFNNLIFISAPHVRLGTGSGADFHNNGAVFIFELGATGATYKNVLLGLTGNYGSPDNYLGLNMDVARFRAWNSSTSQMEDQSGKILIVVSGANIVPNPETTDPTQYRFYRGFIAAQVIDESTCTVSTANGKKFLPGGISNQSGNIQNSGDGNDGDFNCIHNVNHFNLYGSTGASYLHGITCLATNGVNIIGGLQPPPTNSPYTSAKNTIAYSYVIRESWHSTHKGAYVITSTDMYMYNNYYDENGISVDGKTHLPPGCLPVTSNKDYGVCNFSKPIAMNNEYVAVYLNDVMGPYPSYNEGHKKGVYIWKFRESANPSLMAHTARLYFDIPPFPSYVTEAYYDGTTRTKGMEVGSLSFTDDGYLLIGAAKQLSLSGANGSTTNKPAVGNLYMYKITTTGGTATAPVITHSLKWEYDRSLNDAGTRNMPLGSMFTMIGATTIIE